MPMRHVATVLALAVAAAGTAGCGGSSDPKAAPQAGQSTHAGPVSCPTPAASQQPFPSGASSDLPRPDFAASPVALPVSVHGVSLLRFSTAMPLRDAVAFLLRRYPQAGYKLGTGDSEGDEADAPFFKGRLHGTTRISGTGACSTTWLVAVTSGNASLSKIPQLRSHHD